MQNGHLTWDVDQLFAEIITGMKKCAELGKFPESIGVDTWAVDFVLLDAQDQRRKRMRSAGSEKAASVIARLSPVFWRYSFSNGISI